MRAKSLLVLAPRQLAWTSEELRTPERDELLVVTTAGAIRVGSELPIYRGDARAAIPARYPRMTGYESVGRVLESGPEACRFAPGDRLVAFYGHRTHALVPEAQAIAIPP